MSKPTHILRFEAEEDSQVHIGQLVDTLRDVGLDDVDGVPIKAYRVNGSIFGGVVTTEEVLTVKHCSRL